MKTPRESQSENLPAACAEARAALHDRLDGAQSESESVRRHLEECADCRGYFEAAEQLLRTIPHLASTPAPSAGFTDRVVMQMHGATLRSWHRRRWAWAGAFALAASILVAVFVVANTGRKEAVSGTIAVVVPPPEAPIIAREKPVPLRDSLQEAGVAFNALTRKATEENFGFKLPKWPMPMAKVDPQIEPGVVSLQDVRHNAAFSIAPITDSARRAFDVFWRELGPDMESRPKNN